MRSACGDRRRCRGGRNQDVVLARLDEGHVAKEAEAVERMRQEVERLLQVKLETIKRAALLGDGRRVGRVGVGVVAGRREGAAAEGQQYARRDAQRVGGERPEQVLADLDVVELLVEERRRNQRALLVVTFERQVRGLGAVRRQVRIARRDRNRVGARLRDRDARQQRGQARPRHHLRCIETNQEVVGRLEDRVHGRQEVVIARLHVGRSGTSSGRGVEGDARRRRCRSRHSGRRYCRGRDGRRTGCPSPPGARRRCRPREPCRSRRRTRKRLAGRLRNPEPPRKRPRCSAARPGTQSGRRCGTVHWPC